jgi:hypothetical protein
MSNSQNVYSIKETVASWESLMSHVRTDNLEPRLPPDQQGTAGQRQARPIQDDDHLLTRSSCGNEQPFSLDGPLAVRRTKGTSTPSFCSADAVGGDESVHARSAIPAIKVTR